MGCKQSLHQSPFCDNLIVTMKKYIEANPVTSNTSINKAYSIVITFGAHYYTLKNLSSQYTNNEIETYLNQHIDMIKNPKWHGPIAKLKKNNMSRIELESAYKNNFDVSNMLKILTINVEVYEKGYAKMSRSEIF